MNIWDSGGSIWTIELGGIGPGYEQAIQICVVEICRAAIKETPRRMGETEKDYKVRFDAIRDKVVHEIDGMCGGFSGTQVGAASSLAYWFIIDGPEKVFATFKKEHPDQYDERHIQVSKYWPQAPEHKPLCDWGHSGIQGSAPKIIPESQEIDEEPDSLALLRGTDAL